MSVKSKAKDFHAQPTLFRIGDFGLKRQNGYIDEEWHKDLRGVKGQRVYREMLDNEVMVSASFWIIESLIRQTPWEVESAKNGHPDTERAAEHLDQCLQDLERPFKEIVAEALSMLPFGWCALEPTYKIRRGPKYAEPVLRSKFSDGLFGWRDWEIRAQESLDHWVYDDNEELVGFYQRPPATQKTLAIPLDRVLMFRVRPYKGNPEGRSMLRSVYTSYFFVKRLREIEAIGIERNVAGMPVMQVPIELVQAAANTDAAKARDAFIKMVKMIRTDQYHGLVIPSETGTDGQPTGYKFGLLSASGKDFAATDPIIKRYETRMLFQFMTEYLMLGMDRVGALSTSSDKTGMLSNAIDAIADIIEDVINDTAIPRLMELNGFDVMSWPRLVHGDLEKKSIAETFSAVVSAVSSGAMEGDADVENLLRRLVDIPPKRQLTAPQQLTLPMPETTVPPETAPSEPVQESQEPPAPTMSVQEAADYCGVSPNVIRNAVRNRQIPGARVGGSYRFLREDLTAYMRGQHSSQQVSA